MFFQTEGYRCDRFSLFDFAHGLFHILFKQLAVGVEVLGEADAVNGIFMTGIEFDVVREFFDFIQCGKHLFGAAFKQTADAKVKQRVAGEEGFSFRKIPQNMADGVAVSADNFGAGAAEAERISVIQADVYARNTVEVGRSADNLCAVKRFQFQVGVGMVVMVMGVEDILRFDTQFFASGNNRRRFV